jgi:predicted permease
MRCPGFTAIAILTLALGVGATTAVFSVVHGVLLTPLPFADPHRLVRVAEIHQVGGAGSVFEADLAEFRRQSVSFERFSGYGLTTRHLRGAAGAERLTAVVTDHEFFAVLGVAPIAGRTFAAGDPSLVVVISGRLWERRFNRNTSVLGSTIGLEGETFDGAQGRVVVGRGDYTVLGVMPDEFQFPYRAASVYPSALPESQTDLWILEDRRPGGRVGAVTARLRPGVTIGAAAADLSAIETRLDEITPGPYRPTGVQVTSLADDVLWPVRPWLWLLVAAVVLVLVAACANLATLLLARTALRVQELVTRAALGAGPRRLAWQLLTESLLLTAAGGVAGAVVGRWGTDLLIAFGSGRIPRAYEASLDWRVFALLLLVCGAIIVLFSLTPALMAARSGVRANGSRSTVNVTPGVQLSRLRDGLVIGEVALAFVLAFAAATVIGELRRLDRTNPGMMTDNVVTLHLTPRVPEETYYRIEERVTRIAGVDGAGLSHMVPLQNWGGIGTFQVRGAPAVDASQLPTADLRYVTPGYFHALGIPVRAGRILAEGDSLRLPGPVLINEALARRHFAGEDPVGRTLDRGTIVGVVEDVRQVALDRPAQPAIYFPLNRNAGIASDIGMSLIVRTVGPPEAVVGAVRAAVREVNPNVAIFNVRTMDQVIADSLWQLNLYRDLVSLFAILALMLAAIGLSGVITYSVTQRSREFAIRLAVGSGHAKLIRRILTFALRLAAAGLAAGVTGAVALTPAIRTVHAGLETDPVLLAGVSALVIALAMCACALPAARIAGVNPVTVLRHE